MRKESARDRLRRIATRWGLRNYPRALFALVIALHSQSARADCASEFEEAQRARNAGKLLSAEEHAGACAAASCPAFIQTKCSAWREELRTRVPSITLRATDASGKDVERASLTLDGAAIGLDGRAVRLDPGTHVVRLSGPCTLEERVVVAEGERGRAVKLACPLAPPPKQPPPPPPPPPQPPILAYGIAGAGVVALGLGAVFGISALGSASEMRTTCPGPPACYANDPAWQDANAMRSDAKTEAIVADVALALGVVGLAVGAFLYIRSPSARSARAAPLSF